jgi:hypothetical protein
MENPNPNQGPGRGGRGDERPGRENEGGTDPRKTREREQENDRGTPRPGQTNPGQTTPKTG